MRVGWSTRGVARHQCCERLRLGGRSRTVVAGPPPLPRSAAAESCAVELEELSGAAWRGRAATERGQRDIRRRYRIGSAWGSFPKVLVMPVLRVSLPTPLVVDHGFRLARNRRLGRRGAVSVAFAVRSAAW